MSKFVCDLCGYVYDPAEGVPDKDVAAGTDFSALPADWKCPMCEGAKGQFYEVKQFFVLPILSLKSKCWVSANSVVSQRINATKNILAKILLAFLLVNSVV